MSLFKKVTILIVSLITAISSATQFAPYEGEYKNDCPYVFVHGLNGWGGDEGIDEVIPYWGATTGDLMNYLQSEGYECYSASVGPISSAWDRACELYAQIVGTTVDYGEAHSEQYSHARYGRTYKTGLVPDWGKLDEQGKIQKINLIGHSFGGTTVRLMLQLLTSGAADEIKKTVDGSISGLFTGGKGNWVESITTICTPHNSSTVYRFSQDTMLYWPLQIDSVCYAAFMGRTWLNGTYFDFHLEQFGLTNIPGEDNADSYLKSVVNFIKNSNDSAQYDLTPEGMDKLNGFIETNPDVYYFSYAYDTLSQTSTSGIDWPEVGTNPLLLIFSYYMGNHYGYYDKDMNLQVDGDWKNNDGLVNTISEKYPFDEPHTDYADGAKLQRGIWYVMPVLTGDHGTAIGLLADKDVTRGMYLKLSEMLNSLPE